MGAMMEGIEQQIKDIDKLKTQNHTSKTEKIFQVKSEPIMKNRRSFTDRSSMYDIKNSKPSERSVICYRCGTNGHIGTSEICKARNQVCRRCKKVGHFEAICRKSTFGSIGASKIIKPKRIRLIGSNDIQQPQKLEKSDDKSPDESRDSKMYYCFYGGNESNVVDCNVGGIPLKLLVDSGSDINVIHKEAWTLLKQRCIKVINSQKGSSQIIKGYGCDIPLRILGTFEAEISIASRTILAKFFVVEEGQRCILGDAMAKELGILKVGVGLNQLEKRDVPFGRIKDVQVQIHMDSSFKPVFQPVRRVPIPHEAAVNKKLDDLLAKDIIEVKTGPTTWVSPLVIVGKANGEPRVCLDLRRVNEAVIRERFPMPIVDELLARIGSGKVRSKLDIRDAFLQTELAPESRDITTFITSRGLFRFKRLPFGLVSAPEIFQKVMDEILSGCEGTVCYLDDIYVEGEDKEEHDTRLKIVFDRLNKRGVVLNHQKCIIGVSELQFLGHIISSEGMRPAPSKVEALLSFRHPENVAEVKSFLGLANYMNKFIPNLAAVDEPLRRLLHQTVKFVWTEEQQYAFNAISVPFDVTEEVFVNEVVRAAASTAAIRWEEIDRVSGQDEEISLIFEALSNGRLFELPLEYRMIGRELCRVGNVLMRGDRIIVPRSLRELALCLAHEGHPGTRMMKSHLRSSVWWPKLDSDVDNYMKRCRGCLLVSAPNAPEPMSRRSLPARPWEDVAMDFLGPLPEGQYLMVVVDYYSRYYEVCEMTSITAENTITELTMIFSRHGIPVTLTADNAPQLSEECEMFSIFCKNYGILLINTVPYWPQMNGEVERQNRTILKRLQIAQELGQDWRIELQNFLLTYRAASHSTTGRSPAELLFGRKIRTKLPCITSCSNDEEWRDRDALTKEKGKIYSDNRRQARESVISVGDRVLLKRIKKDNKLSTEFVNEEFVVLTKTGSDVTIKSTVSGKQYRRNISHLKKIPEANNRRMNSNDESDEAPTIEVTEEGSASNTTSTVDIQSANEPERKRRRYEPAWFSGYVPY
ncbi:uncharacterized protein K02A2.6-like [Toxorhynchites rutilus septentrionalis]|uniref:uncharacterized protein K02A2.6-like n=1 Tax=Toxorhynchites rutilus septentrionalis TaxID=329112 RepID=UPI002479BFB8|nr:uncharacterized protein K02A2.6-like [Toxorhynchites rutilus septentrionalis]